MSVPSDNKTEVAVNNTNNNGNTIVSIKIDKLSNDNEKTEDKPKLTYEKELEEILKDDDKHPFTPMGYITCARTYLRRLNENDPHSMLETPKQMWKRVIKGANEIGCNFTEEEQKRLMYLLYKGKCTPAGRFLWQLGTRAIKKTGLLSLQNCAFARTDHPYRIIMWIMNLLMLGVGCGSNVQRHNVNKIPAVRECTLIRNDFIDVKSGYVEPWIVPYNKKEWDDICKYDEKANQNVTKLEETQIPLRSAKFLQKCNENSHYFNFYVQSMFKKTKKIPNYDSKEIYMLMPKNRLGWINILGEHVSRTKNIVNLDFEGYETGKIFVAADSREGWVELLGELMKHHYEPQKWFNMNSKEIIFTIPDDNKSNIIPPNKSTEFIYSTTLIRPRGEPIKTFGGTASGPEELCSGLEEINKILNAKIGKKASSLDWVDMICHVAMIVVSGNVRRSALILIGDSDDLEFLNAKNWRTGKVIPNQRYCANLTVACEDIKQLPKEFWDGYDGNGECFGLFNPKAAKKMGRTGEIQYPDPEAEGLNPCFAKNTMIAVADGRHMVSIKQLAKEGKDVPVYSYDKKTGKVSIKWGRNPRVTGNNKKLLRIHFDDKSYIDVTPNHKFYTMDDKTKTADKLKKGDSIPRFKKFIEKDGYVRMYTNVKTDKRKSEHRMIAKFHNRKKFKKVYKKGTKNGFCKTNNVVVHHKDENKSNNSPDNLEITTASEHNREHYGNGKMKGEKNPMYGKKHSKETKEKIGAKTTERNKDKKYLKKVGKKIKKALNNEETKKKISDNTKKSAKERRRNKLDEIKKEAERTELKIKIDDNYNVWVKKKCETCNNKFKTKWKFREVAVCSQECNNKNEDVIKSRKKGNRKTQKKKSKKKLHKQIMIYKDLEEELGRKPLKKEWENECKDKEIPYRLQTKTPNPNIPTSFADLAKRAEDYNHRVVKVEKLEGLHKVYNITVDKNHTVGIITDIEENKSWKGVFAANCGEQLLANFETCCLAELLLCNIESQEEANECARYMYRICKHSLLLPCPEKETEAIVHKNMRIGLGVTGYLQTTEEQKSWLKNTYKYLRAFDIEYSKKIKVNPSIKLTTVKPSGTISTMWSISPGCHPFISHKGSRHIFRTIRMDNQAPTRNMCIRSGARCEPKIEFDKSLSKTTDVVYVPFKIPDGAPTSDETKIIDFANKIFMRLAREWSDNAVSASGYFDQTEKPDVKKFLTDNYDNIKSISFFPKEPELTEEFAQLPYIGITEKEYNEAMKKIIFPMVLKEEDFKGAVKYNDSNIGDMECTSGSCPVR